MKKITLTLSICLLTLFSYSQQIKSIPSGITQNLSTIPGDTTSPTTDEIESAFRDLMENPDTSLNHEKIKAQRWMNYIYHKFNITDGNQFSTQEYSDAVKAIYITRC
ncbi:MAG TPA: hypothetical protein EYG86_05370 [Crocinitomicaceae bacterium]|nr:hypothetical protein [Crocinitomicaceae bacterium]